LLFVAICVGLLLSKIGKTPEGILLITALQGLNVMLVTAVRYMILVTPFGVLSLLMDNILRGMGGLSDLGISIAWYFGVVTLALAIQLFIVFQVSGLDEEKNHHSQAMN
jgi:Na+/H+-dicarboxylate symporter